MAIREMQSKLTIWWKLDYVHFFFNYEHLGSENCCVNTYIDTPKTYKNTIISNY